MVADFRLISLDLEGRPTAPVGAMPPALEAMNERTRRFLAHAGYRVPWVGYVAVASHAPVGGGAFVGPPAYGRVEIAYFTLPQHQRLGYAAMTAGTLVEIARAADPMIALVAKTEPRENPSTRILARLGFRGPRETTDEEIGLAWVWRLDP